MMDGALLEITFLLQAARARVGFDAMFRLLEHGICQMNHRLSDDYSMENNTKLQNHN